MSLGVPSSSPRSHRGRRAGLTALLSGALIASGIVVATTVAAPAGAEPEFQDAGTLVLQTRSNVTTATLGGAEQRFTTTGQCQIASSGTPLLRFSGELGGNPGKVGFQNGTFGVAEKPSGTSCVEVNNNKKSPETLIIKLGGSSAFPLQASSGILDIEAKGSGAQVIVDYLLEGKPEGEQLVFDCNEETSDAGPDAKNGDNCEVPVGLADGATFDELHISASAGAAVSLEGGQDWVGVDSSVKTTFEVGYFGDPPAACDTDIPEEPGTDGGPTVSITNISVTDGDCVSFRYSLTSGQVANRATATFLKPWSEQSQYLQFLMNLTWPIAATDAAELKPIEFGFHDKDLNPGDAQVLVWCPNATFNLAAGGPGPDVSTLTDVEPVRADGSDPFPGVQYACMLPNPEVVADGTGLAWTQSIYVHGDAYARR